MSEKIKPSELDALTGDPEDTAILIITYAGKTYQITISDFFTRVGQASGICDLNSDTEIPENRFTTGTATTKFTGGATTQDALDKQKPHVYTSYGADNVYVYCPEVGVPYMMIINYHASLGLYVSDDGQGDTNRDLLSATEVTQIKWAGGLNLNIANSITSGAVFALTLIRTAVGVIYASATEMDSAAI